MEILVGDDVVAVAHVLQPVDQVQVGGELMGQGHLFPIQAEFGPHVENRYQARRVGDAAAIGVFVVETQQLIAAHAETVGVGDVAEGGHEKSHLGSRCPRGGRTKKGI